MLHKVKDVTVVLHLSTVGPRDGSKCQGNGKMFSLKPGFVIRICGKMTKIFVIPGFGYDIFCLKLNILTLHHSLFGLIEQLLPGFEQLNKIHDLVSACTTLDLFRIQLQLRDDIYSLHRYIGSLGF